MTRLRETLRDRSFLKGWRIGGMIGTMLGVMLFLWFSIFNLSHERVTWWIVAMVCLCGFWLLVMLGLIYD